MVNFTQGRSATSRNRWAADFSFRTDAPRETDRAAESHRGRRQSDSPDVESGAEQELEDFVRELVERKFCQWLLAYFAFAFVGLQIIDVLAEVWRWSVPFQRATTLVLGLGVLPAAVVAWFHGERGRQRVCLAEVTLLGALSAGSLLLIWKIFA